MKLVNDVFPAKFHVYNELLSILIDNGPDMTLTKWVNTVWDIDIAFSTGQGVRLDGMPVCLITDDRVVLRASAGAS